MGNDETGESQLTFEQLRTFQAIASSGSLTRAAERLFLTQPGASKRLRRLEQALGVELFDRRRAGRERQLTAVGRRVLRFADDVSRLTLQLRSEIQGEKITPLNQEVTIATAHARVLPILISAFQDRYPQVRVRQLHCSNDEIGDLVASGTADLGWQLAAHMDERFHRVPIGDDRIVLVSRSDIASPENLEERLQFLRGTPFVLPPADSFIRRLAQEWSESVGVALNVTLESASFDVLVRAIIHRFGVAILPERAILQHLAKGRLRTLPVQGLPRRFYANLIVDAAKPASSSTRAFLRFAGETAWRRGLPPEYTTSLPAAIQQAVSS